MQSTETARPWQLEMFRRSLKKQLKLAAMLRLLPAVDGRRCLLVTCGDNNGALNWYFREQGGSWTWGDTIGENLADMSALLGEPVDHVPEGAFPYEDGQFDCVVSIDVLEHLADDRPFLRELARVLRPGGTALVTVPNGDPALWANRIKWRIGMSPEVYGHVRAGYTLDELRAAVSGSGLRPYAAGGYSRFFTEMMELLVNFGYVFVLARKKGGAVDGQIAPATAGELKTHGLAYRLYGLLFPLMRLFSRLDALLPARTDNAVIVAARKPEAAP